MITGALYQMTRDASHYPMVLPQHCWYRTWMCTHTHMLMYATTHTHARYTDTKLTLQNGDSLIGCCWYRGCCCIVYPPGGGSSTWPRVDLLRRHHTRSTNATMTMPNSIKIPPRSIPPEFLLRRAVLIIIILFCNSQH